MKFHSLILGSWALLAPALATSINDFSCRSNGTHTNPVIFLHGLGATFYEDLNFLQYWLQAQGYCTYAQTYGAYDGFPLLGGLKSIADSAPEIAHYIRTVKEQTGAEKVDVVGHSEGAFQTLYVPKFEGVADVIDKLVAIAPPTRGTTFGGLYKLAYLLGSATRELVGEVLKLVGCPACDDLGPQGPAVVRLNDGKDIVQPGNHLTVITSKGDEMVTPHETSWVHEDGVDNVYVQDFCPLDPVGHIGEAYDLNVWNLVKNALDGQLNRKFFCVLGSPGKA
ncbi:Alpha/Beta hydrolase protein [Aspergillus avenaceus]|uniref:Alpha/Beta hydrolase protein n=1 Tax=Aspergillus avenaceus TaxID=36643 RepID=A0A5N6U9K6_ASPAV|nr:Alpha/Beta hydrolase protein [Aspergillus avenaceus]